MVHVKFDSRGHAEDFVRRQSWKETTFPHNFDGFWCNINQTPEERAAFNQKMKLLFKMKRTICEIMECDAKRIVIDKSEKKTFYVNGSDLQFI